MNGRQIEIFHTIIKYGTVTEAAKRLGITQPAVTTSLRQIENALGFNLFHRSGGRLQPTQEARALYGEAQRIQESLTFFRTLANRLKNDLTSHLRLAAPPALCHQLIPDALELFVGQNNQPLIDISTLHHSQIIDEMSKPASQLSLGFTFGLEDQSNIGFVPIGKVTMAALVPKKWISKGQTHIDITDLVKRPLIGTFSGEPLGSAVENLFRSTESHVQYSIRAHSHSVVANLVQKGLGAAVIDSLTANEAIRRESNPTFEILKITGAPKIPVTAIYSYNHPLSPFARRFIDLFKEVFNKRAVV